MLGVVCPIPGPFSVAASETQTRQLLPGRGQRRLVKLPPIAVGVHAESDSASPVNESSLRTSVELKLRQNGVRVLSVGDSSTYPRAYFNVEVDTMWEPSIWVYRFDVYVNQAAVTVPARAGGIVFARLWAPPYPGLGTAGHNFDFNEVLQKAVLAKVDSFLNDYLAANPRQ